MTKTNWQNDGQAENSITPKNNSVLQGKGGGGHNQVFSIARTMSMRGEQIRVSKFGKFPFFLRWKNVLSVSAYVAPPFNPVKVGTRTWCTLIDRCIIRYISGKRAFYPLHVRYSCGHYLASRPTYIPIARASSGRGDKFCHRITKFCIFLSVSFPVHIRSPVSPSIIA